MKRLENKIALITGAAQGIGLAIAKLFVLEGAKVLITDINEKEAAVQSNKINDEFPGHAASIKHNVTSVEDWKNAIDSVEKNFGAVNILVNNAGTNIPEPFEKIKQTSMNYLVDLNMKAAFNVAQLVVLKMLKNKKKGGSIINMSSQLGHVGMSGRNVYNMTKFGIEGLTKGMGVELAKKNIRVNTVAPTFVETPMVKNFFKNKNFKKLALGNIPMGKAATESDVATTVCFLASSASSMITGTSIIIDGGWTAQ